MPKLIVFSEVGFSGNSKEYRSNDPDLVANGDDFVFGSAIALSGHWNVYDDVNWAGTHISLNADGGPDEDGAYKDPADWGGTDPFHAKGTQVS